MGDSKKESKKSDKSKGYVVAEGKAITCKIGVLAAGKTVQLKMLTGGADALKELVAAGFVVEA